MIAKAGRQPIITAGVNELVVRSRKITLIEYSTTLQDWDHVPIPDSIIPQKASHELLGVLSLLALVPIWITRTIAMTIQPTPTQNMAPTLSFWMIGSRKDHINFTGNNMTRWRR